MSARWSTYPKVVLSPPDNGAFGFQQKRIGCHAGNRAPAPGQAGMARSLSGSLYLNANSGRVALLGFTGRPGFFVRIGLARPQHLIRQFLVAILTKL